MSSSTGRARYHVLQAGPPVGESVTANLDGAGFAVSTATDADEALAMLAERPVDCVVADATFGDAEFHRRVHHVDSLVPVVAYGDAPATDAPAATEGHVDAYVPLDGDGTGGGDADAVVDAVRTVAERFHEGPDRRITHHTPAAVVRDGTLAAVTPAMADLFGHDPGTLADRPFGDLLAETDEDRVADWLESEDAVRTRIDARHADGRRLVLQARLEPVADGATVLTVLDVTDRADEEAALRRDSEMLGSFLESAPLSVYFKDRLSRHERVSDHMIPDPDDYIENVEGKTHVHPADVIGKTDFDLYDYDLAEAAVADDRQVMENEDPLFNELEEGTTSLGETLYTSTTKAPRYDEDGNVVGLVGVTMDVTDREQYRRELERQNERLEEFSEALTHDLHTPLDAARDALETLQAGYDPEAVEDASDALGRMENLIAEIRAFVLQGRTVESPESVGIEEAAREAWRSVDTADATLHVDTDQHVRADPDRLQQVFENLFRNSVEHGSTCSRPEADDAVEHGSTSPRSQAREDALDHGGPEVTVRVEATDDGFAVADDGPGIPEDEREAVFEQGHTTDPDGTGLGLAIIDEIVQAHDWDVRAVESDAGGARFEFSGVVRAEETLGTTIG